MGPRLGVAAGRFHDLPECHALGVFIGGFLIHIIRLRKPWQRIDAAGTTERVEVPELNAAEFDPAGAELASPEAVRYMRHFNLPSGMEAQTRVHLRVAHWSGRLGCLRINDHMINVSEDAESIDLDITDWLERHNRLILELMALPGSPVGLTGEVVLAIG